MEVCTAHGPSCPKYPDRLNPESRVSRLDLELAEMIRAGRIKAGIPAPEPVPCKTKRLSDEQIRQRREYVDTYRAAIKKNQLPPRPPWVTFDPALAEMIRNVREGYGSTTPPAFEEME
ncbi:hypothetical protein [Streptomyces griseoaurantiacus]|uniref:hypothetical protein n=1 Tax=Streptomyces griseoaurantiacus TaxID=68213 RepID=UPI002E28D16F|nr:hypothetical protein [Streptomyces jietaisiensis]